MIDAFAVAQLQDDRTSGWHDGRSDKPVNPLETLILAQHRANFDLWHQEDDARDPNATDHQVAAGKHTIDRLNQQRNDLVEAIDQFLLESAGEQEPKAPLNSETPALMVDRMSILSLKIFHTAIESQRESATEAHRLHNRERLRLLCEQRNDLMQCLSELSRDVREGRRRFKLYRQMKMYNDPELNPAVYERKGS